MTADRRRTGGADLPQLLTPAEVATALRTSRKQVYAMAERVLRVGAGWGRMRPDGRRDGGRLGVGNRRSYVGCRSGDRGLRASICSADSLLRNGAIEEDSGGAP